MEIVEYLTMIDLSCPFFTVNTSVDYVTCSLLSSPGKSFQFKDRQGSGKFVKGDNIVIESYGIKMPEQFAFYLGTSTAPQLIPPLPTFDISLSETVDPDFRQHLCGYVINESAEHFINALLVAPTSAYFELFLDSYVPYFNISMINVPGALNGKKINVLPFLKIRHNAPIY